MAPLAAGTTWHPEGGTRPPRGEASSLHDLLADLFFFLRTHIFSLQATLLSVQGKQNFHKKKNGRETFGYYKEFTLVQKNFAEAWIYGEKSH